MEKVFEMKGLVDCKPDARRSVKKCYSNCIFFCVMAFANYYYPATSTSATPGTRSIIMLLQKPERWWCWLAAITTSTTSMFTTTIIGARVFFHMLPREGRVVEEVEKDLKPVAKGVCRRVTQRRERSSKKSHDASSWGVCTTSTTRLTQRRERSTRSTKKSLA